MRRDNYKEVAESTPFDNEGTEFVSENVQDAIEELFDKVGDSASPGFTWGKGGVVPTNTWLWNEGVPANRTGRNFPLYNGELIQIAVSNEIVNTFDVEIYEHDGTTFTLLATISLTAQRSKNQVYSSILK